MSQAGGGKANGSGKSKLAGKRKRTGKRKRNLCTDGDSEQKEKLVKDPNAPKGAKSAYLFFWFL